MILTYGIGNAKTPRALLSLVREFKATLVDVRARPYARGRPEWNKNRLEGAMGERYLYEGTRLGGIPWREQDGRPACEYAYNWAPTAIKWLDRTKEEERRILLCACGWPGDCHRHQIALALKSSVYHLFGKHAFEAKAFLDRMGEIRPEAVDGTGSWTMKEFMAWATEPA